ARAGGFPGAARILGEIGDCPASRRVGLLPEGPTPIRGGAALVAEEAGEAIGRVTSGGFSPSLKAPIAMGYVPAALAAPGTRLFAEVRGRRLPVSVVTLPFVPARFKRS
ncbi:glycine cleavage T C-terminal barrel domain-containing protein, partial [Methylobacterium sp. WL19]|uniref:glycine cleavage T C-terminal barrel domain-containing protein n=1 Tax=Methylobacterium sp. WL19 TaxID=2603896 RepID=UPI0011D3681E